MARCVDGVLGVVQRQRKRIVQPPPYKQPCHFEGEGRVSLSRIAIADPGAAAEDRSRGPRAGISQAACHDSPSCSRREALDHLLGSSGAAVNGTGMSPGYTRSTRLAVDFPTEDMELTHLLVVSDLDRSHAFYQYVVGAELYRKYGGTSAVFRFLGTWLLLVTAGGPTSDKPDVTFAAPADPNRVSHEMTIRVPDCRAAYETLRSRGAAFLTPPFEYEREIRCFFRDPDGHLLEISEAQSASAS